jgi:hypothetical protein
MSGYIYQHVLTLAEEYEPGSSANSVVNSVLGVSKILEAKMISK